MSGPLKTKKKAAIRAKLPQLCVACGATENLTIDHKQPRVYGGTNEQHNLQMMCQACNQKKGKKEVRYRPPAQVAK